MGQKLSCFSKQTKDGDDISKPRKGKPLARWKVKKEARKDGEADGRAVVEHIESVRGEAKTEAQPDGATKSRPHLVLLEPAPPSMTLPLVAPPAVDENGDVHPPLDKKKFATPYTGNKVTVDSRYVPQTVDQYARDLAQGDAKPATWHDIYWALIGKRKLTRDEDIARALFSWLCSLQMGQNVFATHDELEQAVKDAIPYAQEALKAKSQSPRPDSPEVVLNEWTRSRASYLQAFESLFRHCNIPCTSVRGLAKGVDYNVGMKLIDQLPAQGQDQSALLTTQLQHAWNVAYLDGKWCLFDCMWAAQRFAANASMRNSQVAQLASIENGTEMFYFKADPAKLIISHFPLDEKWQLLNPPVKLKDFECTVLLKPAFFTHGLGIYTHEESVIVVDKKLILKLAIPPEFVSKTLFTFSLKKESRDEKLEEKNLHNFGMDEISYAESTVTFSFRFPMAGDYKLMLYARNIGEKLFSDICEYRIEVRGGDGAPKEGHELDEQRILVHPFPPTSQSHYGPTEMVTDLDIQTIPHNLDAQQKCKDGVFEIRFTTNDPKAKLPRMTARLRSHLCDSNALMDCLLIRVTEGPAPTTTNAKGLRKTPGGGSAVTISMAVITAYLPVAGEYALEVYAAPADSDESSAYFLVWQFLIDSDVGFSMVTPTRKRFATTNLGPKDGWGQLGLVTLSHPDPLVRVPTAVDARSMGQGRPKTEDHQPSGELQVSPDTVSDKSDEPLGPKSWDLRIVLGRPKSVKLSVIGQLVDISCEKDEDKTDYLLQDKLDDVDEADDTQSGTLDKFAYLVRIPTAQHFYKLYVYATRLGTEPASDIPLVYTYLIEAPARISSAEKPYVGVQLGAFPEKVAQKEASTAADTSS